MWIIIASGVKARLKVTTRTGVHGTSGFHHYRSSEIGHFVATHEPAAPSRHLDARSGDARLARQTAAGIFVDI